MLCRAMGVAVVLRYTRAGSELPYQTAEAALCRSFFVIIIEWWSLPLKHLYNAVENITYLGTYVPLGTLGILTPTY